MRARFSDAQRCNEPKLDLGSDGVGFIEALSAKTKTSNTSHKRHRLLPLTGIAVGFTGRPWAEAWLDARKALQMDAASSCLMPAPQPGGSWSESKLTASEANTWLHEIFASNGSSLKGRNVGTHSAKATLLSMAAKAHVPLKMRRMLGYHAKPGERMALEYSRDAMSEPLAWLQAVIHAVAARHFLPDETRSGRWKPGAKLSDFMVASETNPVTPGLTPGEAANIEQPQVGQEQDVTVGLDWEFDDAGAADQAGGGRSQSVDGFEPLRPELSPGLPGGPAGLQASTTSSGSSSSGEESVDSDSGNDLESTAELQNAAEIVARTLRPRGPAKKSSQIWVKHAKRGTYHLMRLGSTLTLACGRSFVTERFNLLDSPPEFQEPKCEHCFGSTPEAAEFRKELAKDDDALQAELAVEIANINP